LGAVAVVPVVHTMLVADTVAAVAQALFKIVLLVPVAQRHLAWGP